MGTRVELLLCGDDPVYLRAAGEEALDEIERLEAQLSLYRPDSELSGVNARAARGPVVVEPRFFRLLERVQDLWVATEGAFDPTIAPLMRAWGLRDAGREVGELPTPEALAAAREAVGFQHVVLDPGERTVRLLRPGMSLDLGGIGKGYAIERAVELLQEAGVTTALLHAGTSTVFALGAPPGEDAWTVAIRDPREPDKKEPYLARVRLRDRALSVSAPHGKAITVGNRRIYHVLDPRRGEPVEGARLAALVTASPTDADALSTALLVLGSDGAALARRYDPGCSGLLLPEGEEATLVPIGETDGTLQLGGGTGVSEARGE